MVHEKYIQDLFGETKQNRMVDLDRIYAKDFGT